MKEICLILGSVLFLFPGLESPLVADVIPEFREPGVLYFDDALSKGLTVPVTAPIFVYMDRNFNTVGGSLAPNQPLTLLGAAPEGYFIRCTYRNNTLQGWIKPEDLPSSIDPRVIEDAKKEQKRRNAIAEAILAKKVIRGMGPEDVTQSLGRPEKVTSKVDADGKEETWTYTTYREELQNSYSLDAFGRAVLTPYYVRIPIGSVVVTFVNGSVTGYEETRTNTLTTSNSPSIHL